MHFRPTPKLTMSLATVSLFSSMENDLSGEKSSRCPPFQRAPTQSRQDIDVVIHNFLEANRPRMKQLAESAKRVPSLIRSWEPPSSNPLAEHISTLHIPLLSSNKPSLLLHGIGKEVDDTDAARIADIFSFGSHTYVIFYTLSLLHSTISIVTECWSILQDPAKLLTGLCRRWGFYFVARPDPSGIGSQDMWQFLNALDGANHPYEEANAKEDGLDSEAAFAHMEKTLERRLAQLLLARFLLLNLLVQEATSMPGGLRDKEHRRLWVLLQAQPHIFSPNNNRNNDVFTSLAMELRFASIEYLNDRIGKEYEAFRPFMTQVLNPFAGEDETPPLFLVLDNAQIIAGLPRRGEFRSSDHQVTDRPESVLLRQIWLQYTTVLQSNQMRVVLSCTGIDLQQLKDPLYSSPWKPESYCVHHDTGAFEDAKSQAEYIKRYIPAYWTQPNWNMFLVRAWAWLRGR